LGKQEILQQIIAAQVEGRKSLMLGNEGLTELPEAICELTHLEELHLAYNMLTTLPESIGNLTNLKVLNLAWNNMQVLPRSLSKLTNLRDLFLEGSSELRELPAPLRVEFLHLINCSRIETLPDGIIANKIDIANTGLTGLPNTLKDSQIYWKGLLIDYRLAFQRHTITVMDVIRYHDEMQDNVLNIMGYERFLQEGHAITLDTRQQNTGYQQLIRIKLSDNLSRSYLSIRNPRSGEWRLIPVTEKPQTCEQAVTEVYNAWVNLRSWYSPAG
jgi:Leucine-rich repeat (LRR) protein